MMIAFYTALTITFFGTLFAAHRSYKRHREELRFDNWRKDFNAHWVARQAAKPTPRVYRTSEPVQVNDVPSLSDEVK